MKTTVVILPFDLFGSSGTADGARLVGDELREILADNRREQAATRARAYAGKVRLREFTFETLADYQDWRPKARQAVRQALARNDFLLWVAGNHLGVLPVYDELATRWPDTLVVQFDAHLDIHHFSTCTAELSHGNFLQHCDGPLPPLINVGHRELLLPAEHVTKYYRQAFSAAELAVNPGPAIRQVRKASQAAPRVFLDIDCDVLDAAHFPAVSNPVPFGLDPLTLLRFLEAAWSERVVGLTVSEFDPGRDQADRSLSLLMWLLEHVLLRRYSS